MDVVSKGAHSGRDDRTSSRETLGNLHPRTAANFDRNNHRGPGSDFFAWIVQPTESRNVWTHFSEIPLAATTNQSKLDVRKPPFDQGPHVAYEPTNSLFVGPVFEKPDETNSRRSPTNAPRYRHGIEAIREDVDACTAAQIPSVALATNRDHVKSPGKDEFSPSPDARTSEI
jgi:hypothetical protein